MLQSQSRIERRLAAVLSADIKSYSAMMGADEEETHRRVCDEIGRLAQQLAKFGARIFSDAGDGLMAEFRSMSAAMKAALQFQEESAERNRELLDADKIQFRIGIHLGDIIVKNGRVGGTSVNIAARLEELAEPGGICISGAVHDQLNRTMPLDYEYVAEARLKNIAGSVPVFRVRKSAEPMVAIQERLRGDAVLALPNLPSIAILPFTNFGGPGDDRLCDSLAEDITTGLAKFRNLFVIGRHSAFAYRDRQAETRRIAQELGVRYLLQGSVRRSERRLRITTQLLDGQRGRILLAEQFDEDVAQLFDIEDEILQRVVVRLAISLDGLEHERLRHFGKSGVGKSSLAAYGHLLKGQEFVWRFNRRSNISAREQFLRASACDPNYARAYAALSRTYNWEWRYGWTDERDEALDQALELAKRSLSLDSLDPRAHSELGFAYLYKKERELAIESYRRALELNPNDPDILAELGDAYAYDDQLEKSLDLLNRAMRLNPLYPDWYLWYLADAFFALERYDDAISAIRRMRDPSQGHRLAAASYAHVGRIEEARACAKKILTRQPDFSVARWAEVPPEKVPERLDRLVSGLKMAGLPD